MDIPSLFNISEDDFDKEFFELFDLGYITHIERAESFILTNGFINTFSIPSKRKSSGIAKQQTILRPSLYTPEFKIIWNKQIYSKFVWIPESNSKFEKPFIGHQIVNSISGDIEIISFIECKGSGLFDFKNMTRLFGNNQKVVWEKYKIYINLIKPIEFFKKWWCPELFLKTFAGKKRVINFTIKKLKDFMNL